MHITYVKKLRATPSSKRVAVFRSIPVQAQGLALLGLSERLQTAILEQLTVEEIVECVRFLDPDETTDVLQVLTEKKKNKVITELEGDIQQKVAFLLKFHPETAAGIMNLDYIQVEVGSTFKYVANTIREHEQKTGKFPVILIVRDGMLAGEIPGYALATHVASDTVDTAMRPTPSISYLADYHMISEVFLNHPHAKIVVLDDTKSILGIIFADDMLKIISKRQQKELYTFAGVHEEEDVMDTAWMKVKSRYMWLMLNLATAFLAAFIVSMFESTIAAVTLLAVYMPIVAGMGGNAGTQSMAVTVRGIALRKVTLSHGMKLIKREVIAGAINGAINGVIVAAIATLINQSARLGLVLGIAMVVNLIVAGLFGSLVPLIMKRFGKDPATSATIFITTATDVFGFLVFLGLATLLL